MKPNSSNETQQPDVDDSEVASRNLTQRLLEFARAAENLQGAWDLVPDDGNHPIQNAYPFTVGFDDVALAIENWKDAAIISPAPGDLVEIELATDREHVAITGMEGGRLRGGGS